MMDDNGRLLVFAKAPRAGKVKTRLQPTLSAQQCAQLQKQLIEHCLHIATAADVYPVELWSDDINDPFIKSMATRFTIKTKQQVGDTLGARMQHAMQTALQSSSSVMIIGSDCPALNTEYLQRAATSSNNNPGSVVIGPANDGGYVLLASNKALDALFQNINWGSDTVLQQTCNNLEQQGINCIKLPTLWDLDRCDDLKHLESIHSPTGAWNYLG